MFLIIVGVIIAAVLFFKYCESIGNAEDEYTNRPPTWNPPIPPLPPLPGSLEEIPRKSGCCCANCKYLYTGCKTEYWFDHNALKGASETTQYRNWCLRIKGSVEREIGYRLNEIHNCGLYDPKT